MKKITGDRSEKKKETRNLVMTGTLFIVLVVVCVLIFLKCYSSYMDKLLYAERLKQMEEVTGQLFTGLEDVVDTQWNEAEIYCNYIELGRPKTLEDMLTFIGKEAKLNNLEQKSTDIVGIDEQGRYYTQDGSQGVLTEMDYLLDEPEQVSFISKAATTGKAKMYFLYHLDEPISVQTETRTVNLIYYGLSRDMDELNPYFECDAYDGNNTVYIINPEGEKLFGGNNNDVLEGYNAYSVLKNMEYLHETSFEDAKKELDSTGKAYSNVVLNNTEYYYSLYKMQYSQWTMLFMVPSEYVAMNTVSMINTTVRLILAFAVLVILVSVSMVVFLLQMKQRQILTAERKNSEQLAVINKRLEKAVHEADSANKAKSDFLANMSHDIRTPMNAIVGITNLMEHENGTSDKMHDYIQKVQLSSRHLLGLINDILDMSKIESNEVKLNTEAVSLAEQIGQIDSIIRAQANEHNQTFCIYVNKIVHEYLICDGVRLRQVFLNLLSNAVKYTPDGGSISLKLAEVPCDIPDHAKFVYTVTDNGYGMDPEFIKHIFEPFTRAEDSVTNKVQGTGLGMAITKNIVDLMGGKIRVESELGKGSTFEITVTLPVNKNVSYEIGIEKVLLVSAEERLICNMKASVSESPVQLYSVSSEEEAAEWLMQKEADVILLSGCFENKNLQKTVSLLRSAAGKEVLIFGIDYKQENHEQDMVIDSELDGMILRPFFLSSLSLAIARMRTAPANETDNYTILNGMSFLCAEDNELNAEILKEILDMYGASCMICSNGEEIVESFKHVKTGEYDAILMDIQMPRMNGFEATRAIRSSENPLGKTIPIIAMTANAFSEDIQHCISAGMDAHIAKPIDIAILEKTLRGFSAGGGQIEQETTCRTYF